MRHDRPDAGRLDPGPKLAHFRRRHDAAAPLARILGEDLQRLAAMSDRTVDGARQSARDRHMRAEPRHLSFPPAHPAPPAYPALPAYPASPNTSASKRHSVAP